jgi:hypothetical protein
MVSLLTCSEFLRQLGDYLEGTTESSLRGLLETHVRNCRKCSVVLDTTQKTIRLFRQTQPPELPEHLRIRLMSAIEAKIVKRRR